MRKSFPWPRIAIRYYSYTAPSQYVGVNCRGTLNLLEAALRQGVERFVHTSTSETYGTEQYTPIVPPAGQSRGSPGVYVFNYVDIHVRVLEKMYRKRLAGYA